MCHLSQNAGQTIQWAGLEIYADKENLSYFFVYNSKMKIIWKQGIVPIWRIEY